MIEWLVGKYKSIKFRLLFAFFLTLIVASSLIGWHLDQSYRTSQQQILQQQLKLPAQLFSFCLSGSSGLKNGQIDHCGEMQSLIAPHNNVYLYNQQLGLIWQLKSRLSPAAPSSTLQQLLKKPIHESSMQLLQGHYFLSLSVLGKQRVIISNSGASLRLNIAEYRRSVVVDMLLMVLVLLCCFVLILHRVLQPLTKMVAAIENIASGKSDQLQDEYVLEFHSMRNSLNNLLNAERVQRERYRNTLADLAHSLKTPLAVMQGATSENLDYKDYLSVACEQIRRMDQIIQYQLTRAVNTMGDGAKRKAVKVTPIVERILSALGKVYREKEVQVILNLNAAVELNADERDLMEMLGNMLENAFKYCRSEVAVSIYSDEQNVFIIIEDDGAGVSENMRQVILQRGERADTSAAPGQGIGLSVSVDILSAYNCHLEVEDSFSLGGAKFSITFPRY
ncbi:MAG: ATP-binding protein [Pseudomonadales bacterium]|nr:ATP-binding protein [Pseudomonadales bacterium]NRA15715.1 GHKL domain-containing protein [Oceanospirillaceae bacterium]